MPRWIFAIAVLLLSASSTVADTRSPGAPPAVSSPATKILVELREIFRAILTTKPDSAAMAAGLDRIIADPAFVSLAPAQQHAAYLFLALMDDSAGRLAEALKAVKKACGFATATDADWRIRAVTASELHDTDEAADSLIQLAQHWPATIGTLHAEWILHIFNDVKTRPGGEQRASALASALLAMSWHPDDPYPLADPMWMFLTRDRLEKGDLEGAQASGALITDVWSIVEANADKRFDAVTTANRKHFDVAEAVARNLADARSVMSAAPAKLAAINRVAEILEETDKPEEALPLIDDALARAKAGKPFSDQANQLNWTFDLRSRLLFDLGRADEALSTLVDGAKEKEYGEANVSQTINLADSYDQRDKPQDAMNAVANLGFDNASPYGRMALQDARACAYFLLGDTKQLHDALTYMNLHAGDGVQNYIHTLKFIGDRDGLAVELIRELKDPQTRGTTLVSLQEYRTPPHLPPRAEAAEATLRDVRARKDVQQEIAKIGHTAQYPLLPQGF